MIPAERIVDVEQGTPEWFKARAGHVTASRIDCVLAQGAKGKEAKTRRDYRAQIVAEILTGESQERIFDNDDLRWGREQEPFAIGTYEIERGVLIDRVGFVKHPTIARAGCSPDGVVSSTPATDGSWGLVQIKCPKTATHIGYILDQEIPGDYLKQMHWEMACTGAHWVDFVSFDPRMSENLQLWVCRLKRDSQAVESQEKEVSAFLAGVDEVLARLKNMGGSNG